MASTIDVDYLWAGPRGVTAEHIRVAAPGLDANVERVDVRVALWSSLTRLSLDVEHVQLRGVEVRVSPPAERLDAAAARSARAV